MQGEDPPGRGPEPFFESTFTPRYVLEHIAYHNDTMTQSTNTVLHFSIWLSQRFFLFYFSGRDAGSATFFD